ncbi:MAG: hypothetical protein ACRDV9_08825 [Acidimicrobiia bacterium]
MHGSGSTPSDPDPVVPVPTSDGVGPDWFLPETPIDPPAEIPTLPTTPCLLCATPVSSAEARCPVCSYPRTARLSGRDRWLLVSGFVAVWLATFLGALALS